jgi:hypothetical protein
VALLVIVGGALAATGTFSSSDKKPKPPPLTIPSTAASTPTAPPETTPTAPTSTGPTAATKAAYIIQFDRVQRSYSKLVAKLIRKARNPNSVGDIITAFKRLKTLYGSTATRIGNLETPGEIQGVSRTYTATLRVSSAGVNLIIACARARSESCYTRRLNSLSSRTRRIRKKSAGPSARAATRSRCWRRRRAGREVGVAAQGSSQFIQGRLTGRAVE